MSASFEFKAASAVSFCVEGRSPNLVVTTLSPLSETMETNPSSFLPGCSIHQVVGLAEAISTTRPEATGAMEVSKHVFAAAP